MKRQTISTLLLAAAALASVSLHTSIGHAVTLNIFPAYGPAATSPSTGAYNTNAINALLGLSVPNRDNDPAGYELIGGGPIPIGEVLTSVGFNSWRGQADPTAGWDDGINPFTPGAFSAQFGNAAYFGLCALADPNQTIKLEDLSGQIRWEEAGNVPSSLFTQTFSFAAGDLTAYTPTRVGVDYGGDGLPGGGDDVLITSGLSSTPVNAIYLVGLADAINVSQLPGNTDQDDLDVAIAKVVAAPQQFLKASYMLNGVTGTGVVTLLPEPATGGTFGILMALVALRRRR